MGTLQNSVQIFEIPNKLVMLEVARAFHLNLIQTKEHELGHHFPIVMGKMLETWPSLQAAKTTNRE